MIDAKELRIGNLVNFSYPEEDAGGSMIGVSDDRRIQSGADIQHVADWPDMYNGILLTPEILEKCWFKPISTAENDDDPDYSSIGWRAYYAASYMEGGKDHFCIWDDQPRGYMMDGFSSAPLKYLHQLQNLFYCLTGQELEVKL